MVRDLPCTARDGPSLCSHGCRGPRGWRAGNGFRFGGPDVYVPRGCHVRANRGRHLGRRDAPTQAAREGAQVHICGYQDSGSDPAPTDRKGPTEAFSPSSRRRAIAPSARGIGQSRLGNPLRVVKYMIPLDLDHFCIAQCGEPGVLRPSGTLSLPAGPSACARDPSLRNRHRRSGS